MPAYLMAIRMEPVQDEVALGEYQQRTRALPPSVALRPVIAYGDVTSLEGTAPDGVVVIQFDTVEDAQSWYNSADYQAAIPYRQKAADYKVFIVEGLPTG